MIKMNLNFRGLDPKIVSKIHAHRIEHGHPNLTATLECVIMQWDEQRLSNSIKNYICYGGNGSVLNEQESEKCRQYNII